MFCLPRMIAGVLPLLFLRKGTCRTVHDDIKVNFTDKASFYQRDVMNSLCAQGEFPTTSSDGCTPRTEINLPMDKTTFDITLDLCKERPSNASDLDFDMLYHILDAENSLAVPNQHTRSIFFRNVARKSLLGAHFRNIVSQKSGHRDAIYENLDFVPRDTHVRLLRGFVHACGLEIRFFGNTGVVCPCGESYMDHGCLDGSEFSVNEVRIFPEAEGILQVRGVWMVLGWFFERIRITSLILSGCAMSSASLAGISGLKLASLNIQGCDIAEGCLALWAADSPLCTHLLDLDVSNNALNIQDLVAISWIKLYKLNVQNCGLTRGCISSLCCNGAIVVESLRVLEMSISEVGQHDIDVLAKTSLTYLGMGACKILGNLDSFAHPDSVLLASLQTLQMSYNKLQDRDVAALGKMRVAKLLMVRCEVPPGSLKLLVGKGCLLKRSLMTFDISLTILSPRDVAAVARMRVKQLSMVCCGLTKGDISVLGSALSKPRKYLELFRISMNDLGKDDLHAISLLPVRDLEMESCGLYAGSLLAFVDASSVLKYTLTNISVAGNSLGHEDHKALSQMQSLVHVRK